MLTSSGSGQATIEFMNGRQATTMVACSVARETSFPRAIRLHTALRPAHNAVRGIGAWQFITARHGDVWPLSRRSLNRRVRYVDRPDENRCLPVPEAVDCDRKWRDFRPPYCRACRLLASVRLCRRSDYWDRRAVFIEKNRLWPRLRL